MGKRHDEETIDIGDLVAFIDYDTKEPMVGWVIRRDISNSRFWLVEWQDGQRRMNSTESLQRMKKLAKRLIYYKNPAKVAR